MAVVDRWALRGTGAAAQSAGWMTYAIAGVLLAFLVLVVGCCIWALVRRQPERDDTDEGDGGIGSLRERPTPPGPSDGDPPWWPEFERQFAAHVADRLTRAD